MEFFRFARTPEERRESRLITLSGVVVGIGLGAIVFVVMRHPEWSAIASIRGWFGLPP